MGSTWQLGILLWRAWLFVLHDHDSWGCGFDDAILRC